MKLYGDHFVPGRWWCVRIWRRPASAPQRPYFGTRTCIYFGAGRFGVQIMRTYRHPLVRRFLAKRERAS